MTTFVIAKDGTLLMPTFNIKKVRRMLKDGRAVIHSHHPFTIKLTYEGEKNVQPIEFKIDTGDHHIGISVCSEKHEYAHEEYDLLIDETERHDDCRKYRRARRNRKRYRKPRFNNRRGREGKLAPGTENKKDQHIRLYERYHSVTPIINVTVEVGNFDTQVLEAVEAGKPIPQGVDYQHGPKYGFDTLREAVFFRDNYTCICCGSTLGKIKQPDGEYKKGEVILRMHHLGFKKGDHSDRMANLATVCKRCHTAANHKPGGKLYDLNPKIRPLKGAAFMNQVRWRVVDGIRAVDPSVNVKTTYGAATKRTRLSLNLEKTHANDAYCMGSFHPAHRARPVYYKKVRRNDRILQRFYDAKYIDIRDGKKKTGSQLSCGRTNRSEPRNSDKNQRIYRGEKVSKGHVSIRKQRTEIKPGSIVLYKGERMVVHGTHVRGEDINVEFTKPAKDGKKSASIKILKVVYTPLIQAWKQYTPSKKGEKQG